MSPTDPRADALRALSLDAALAAGAGHPGMPMGMAEAAVALWGGHLKHNPLDPRWPDRDRFVLSDGHGSLLLYSLLHLTGYPLPMSELKRFRRLHSMTPGHPEVGYTPGVEASTGPLGQGLANAVGMALAERLLAAEFNRDGFPVVDHRTYAFVGDGCLMEGISHEAAALAGAWRLAKLTVLHGDNGTAGDGSADDTAARFRACGWNVIDEVDGHSVAAVDEVLRAAAAQTEKPTLIRCRTAIGQGAPTDAGAPPGAAEIATARAALGWRHAPFEIPRPLYDAWDARQAGATRQARWEALMAAYRAKHRKLAAEFDRRQRGALPDKFAARAARQAKALQAQGAALATREASREAIAFFARTMPELIGGSAAPNGSSLTRWPAARPFRPGAGGNYLHYGAREFGMAGIINGLQLHGGLRAFGGAFLAFSDYARNALRMAALMRLNSIHVFTHDSIGLGEDGPAHQPVEQLAALRLIPNMDVWRPCDAVETLAAWQAALEHAHTPTSLVLSRQELPCQSRTAQQVADIRKGGYVLRREGGPLRAILIATGSEVQIAVAAWQELAARGVHARVVSMPSCHVFDQQEPAYRHTVLPFTVPALAVEAGATAGWGKYVGRHGAAIGIDTFGESAPAGELFRHFGITAARTVAAALKLISH
ncbi:transketolase [Propionivibrio sp.]|uniref:transketolase n=1 Tax=Propionivibrio sp. TaxID=2212460 RepID=UPI0039E4D0CF